MSWNSIVILICIALAAFGAYREYAREIRSYLTWRILAILIAATILACLILPISYPGNTIQTTGKHKILLTQGFDKDSLQAEKSDSIYTLDRSVLQQYPKAMFINDASIFSDNLSLDIFGFGLNKEELNQLVGHHIIFHPSPIPYGFIAANWTDQLKVGEVFEVQIKYKNTLAKACKIVLKGLNTTLDSAEISANTNSDLTLKSTPKNIGKAVYTLLVITNKDTLEQEQLPVIINPIKPLKVLILSASPDFETKFLKIWLSQNGYGVASRSTITKGKYSLEYINMAKPDLTHLSAAVLEKFDVLIGDLSLLKGLPVTENAALQQQVQKGMGIIIRADSSGKASSWLQRYFLVTSTSGKQTISTTLNIQGKGKTAKLNLDPAYINAHTNTQTLVTDEHNHIAAAAALFGAGRLVFTTISNSHNWLLNGNNSDYYLLWSSLINKAVRKEPITENWAVKGDLPVPNKPTRIVIENTSIINSIKINQSSVYPSQNPAVPFEVLATYWPNALGWQQSISNNGTPYWWYVWRNNAWKSLTAANKLNTTNQYVQEHKGTTIVTKQIRQKNWVLVPKIYFFILFLMAMTFLWAESKFLAR
ncbi:MAG: hypothetical protein JWQ34_815 [Mucilaginibacter sp.]|uniref:hypothetical protein n=1 Tax=Mucilaginibacter sp. TaxID=1882438 RepID=UPI0026059C6E|nr:hypothetical protein [Mucilaginibacter sp.]MDB5002590.1 hypothetical protein [Mucilaginibacter sp.]